MILVALDPSLTSTGLAVFFDVTLVHASSVQSPSGPGADLAARVLAMAAEVKVRVRSLYQDEGEPVQVATERQQVYRGPRAKGDPNDLAAILAVGTATAALLRAWSVSSYTPADWAGQLPKAEKGDCKASPRALRLRSRLAGLEVAVWDGIRRSDHDAIDAVGIGLHVLGRGIRAGTKGRPSSRPA